MCFAIPYKIISVEKTYAIIESGKKITLGNEIKASAGEYVQVIGNVAVGVLSKKEGLTIRKLIKSIYE